METSEQKALIRQIEKAKNTILAAPDNTIVIPLLQEIRKQAEQTPPAFSDRFNNTDYKLSTLYHIFKLMDFDRDSLEKIAWEDEEWEGLCDQISSTLVMLMMVYADGGISRVNEILNESIA